jgi:DNA repair exonuclease SbcCD nuclease subunit
MTDEEKMPLWMSMFQKEILRRFDEMSDNLKDMVTRDTFRDEKVRVSDELTRKGQEISELRADLQKESTARQATEIAAAAEALVEAQSRQRVQSATNWQWILIVGTAALNYLMRFLPGGSQ